MITCHSEYGTIQNLWIKPVQAAFQSQDYLKNQWEELNYLSEPDYQVGLTEYQAFTQLLAQGETKIHQFEMDSQVMIDSIYCRDATIATDFGMIICNMGKGSPSQ